MKRPSPSVAQMMAPLIVPASMADWNSVSMSASALAGGL
jgi:hypothetical protein